MSAIRRPFRDLPASQQAGILSGNPKFRSFVAACLTLPARMASESEAAEYIRRHCSVRSRADLDRTGPEGDRAADRFRALRTEYDAWRGAIPRQR